MLNKHIAKIKILILIIGLFYLNSAYYSNNLDKKQLLELNKIELAKSPQEKARGLMYRTSLCKQCAMLFIYKRDVPGQQGFWMKNTYISLDMIFINSFYQIVAIHSDTKPLDTSIMYRSPAVYSYVLETNAGLAKRNNLKIGDYLDLDYLFAHSTRYAY
jgi:uncharacterized membrane protein (UPF0127 family)